MFVHPYARHLVGILLCGAAALSLTSMLLPQIMAAAGLTDVFWARLLLSEYTAHTVLIWAAAGGWLASRGNMPAGGICLAVLGSGTGFFATTLVRDWQFVAVTLTVACGGFYGLTVGLLVGRLLETPQTGHPDATVEGEKPGNGGDDED